MLVVTPKMSTNNTANNTANNTSKNTSNNTANTNTKRNVDAMMSSNASVGISMSIGGATCMLPRLSKNWVLPPRPKPGRKPVQDVPTTKRKAQNRAAQRAFREQRANRVSELEEQLMREQREHALQVGALTARIKELEQEVRKFTDSCDARKRANSIGTSANT